jgi:hypothetical protein
MIYLVVCYVIFFLVSKRRVESAVLLNNHYTNRTVTYPIEKKHLFLPPPSSLLIVCYLSHEHMYFALNFNWTYKIVMKNYHMYK